MSRPATSTIFNNVDEEKRWRTNLVETDSLKLLEEMGIVHLKRKVDLDLIYRLGLHLILV